MTEEDFLDRHSANKKVVNRYIPNKGFELINGDIVMFLSPDQKKAYYNQKHSEYVLEKYQKFKEKALKIGNQPCYVSQRVNNYEDEYFYFKNSKEALEFILDGIYYNEYSFDDCSKRLDILQEKIRGVNIEINYIKSLYETDN